MRRKASQSSILSKYSEKLRENPRSRVFAPLAEAYRSMGATEEALDILKQGLKYHPSYTLAYIVLAHCQFDLGKFDLAYSTLRPFVSKNLENISLQKLFARICLKLDYKDEALQTYKYLLLLNPMDKQFADQVEYLEGLLQENYIEPISSVQPKTQSEEDDWVQVSFNSELDTSKEESIDSWNMQSPKNILEIASEKIEQPLVEYDLDDDFYSQEFDTESEDVIEDESSTSSEPIITHTLVDLYCKQGHISKAIEILESILELHPNDHYTRERLEKLKSGSEVSEESTTKIDIVNEQNQSREDASNKLIAEKLHLFLDKIQAQRLNRISDA